MPYDWSQLITRGFESKELDYKGPCAWDANDKLACCKLVKDILALANSNGGWLVIGVNEPSKGAFSLDGMTEEQAASFETTRVNQFLQNYAEPPINLTIVRVNHDGKIFVIIQVPGFPDTPHICQKELPGALAASTLYVRTDNNESAAIKSSADFRAIVEHAVRKRSDTLLSSIRAVLTEGTKEPAPTTEDRFRSEVESARQKWSTVNPDPPQEPRLEVAFLPLENKKKIDFPQLKEMAFKAGVDFRGWPFLFISRTGASDWTYRIEDGFETCESEPGKTFPSISTFWQIRQSGLFYWKQPLHDARQERSRGILFSKETMPERFLDFDGFSMLAGEMVHCLTHLYDSVLDDGEAIRLQLLISGLDGYPLGTTNSNRTMVRTYLCRMNEIPYEATNSLADWKAGLVSHAIEICRAVFGCFNWDSPNFDESKKLIERMLNRQL